MSGEKQNSRKRSVSKRGLSVPEGWDSSTKKSKSRSKSLSCTEDGLLYHENIENTPRKKLKLGKNKETEKLEMVLSKLEQFHRTSNAQLDEFEQTLESLNETHQQFVSYVTDYLTSTESETKPATSMKKPQKIYNEGVVAKATKTYNATRWNTTLASPKFHRNFTETPKRATAEEILAFKLQKQCLLLMDTPQRK